MHQAPALRVLLGSLFSSSTKNTYHQPWESLDTGVVPMCSLDQHKSDNQRKKPSKEVLSKDSAGEENLQAWSFSLPTLSSLSDTRKTRFKRVSITPTTDWDASADLVVRTIKWCHKGLFFCSLLYAEFHFPYKLQSHAHQNIFPPNKFCQYQL